MPVLMFIILGVIIFLIASLAFVGHLLEARRSKLREQRKGFSCELRICGGMEDVYHTMTLKPAPEDQASVLEEIRTEHGEHTEKNEKNVSVDVLDQLMAFFEENHVSTWGNLPPREEQALDAPTITVIFHVDETEYCFSSDQQLPVPDSISRIRKIFSTCQARD